MPIIEEALEKFSNLPLESILTIDSIDVSQKVKKLSVKHGINLAPMLIFVIVDDLDYHSAKKYLKNNFEINESVASKIFNEMEEEIFQPLVLRLNFLNSKNEISVQDCANYIKEIFKNNLINEIKSDSIIKEKFNYRIFSVAKDDADFFDTLEKIFYSNQENLAHLTISAWLKDFVSSKGSGIFDEIELSDYLMRSPNCKGLNEDDKRLVRKLLLLYRNVKFFPESMPNDTGDNWEIIPIDDEKVIPKREKLGVPKTHEERQIDHLQETGNSFGVSSLERKVIEEEINSRKKIEGLKILAKKYPEGSLEWRAIMDEIRKLEK